jgi:PEGA domain
MSFVVVDASVRLSLPVVVFSLPDVDPLDGLRARLQTPVTTAGHAKQPQSLSLQGAVNVTDKIPRCCLGCVVSHRRYSMPTTILLVVLVPGYKDPLDEEKKMKLSWLLLLFALSGVAHAANNGVLLAVQCRVAIQAGGTGALPPPAWKCLSYLDGWLEGLDGALVTDDKGVLQTVAVGDGVTAIQAASAYVQYMDNRPEEKNNPRQLALWHAMLDAGLVRMKPNASPAGDTKAEPAIPAAPSSVTVKSTPPGADINVDGKWMGNTSSTIQLSPGEHTIVIEKEGLISWQRTMTVNAGESVGINATLEKPAHSASR